MTSIYKILNTSITKIVRYLQLQFVDQESDH